MVNKVVDFLVARDMYGHAVGLNYRGSDNYQTKVGAIFTLVTYVLMVQHLVQLLTVFNDGSNQDEKVQTTTWDIFSSEPFVFRDYNFDIIITEEPKLPQEIGRITVNQNQNQVRNDLTTKTEVQLKQCNTNDNAKQLQQQKQYWLPKLGAQRWEDILPQLQCIDNSELFVQGDSLMGFDSSLVEIQFEMCIDGDNCKSEEEIDQYFKTQDFTLSVNYSSMQIDMKNYTQPIQELSQVRRFVFQEGVLQDTTMMLAKTEFTDKVNYLGFWPDDPEPFTFIAEENYQSRETKQDQTGFSFKFLLSNKKHSQERQVYTFFTLIGDFGGFYGAIILLPSLIMSQYNTRMFNTQLLQDLPVREQLKERTQMPQPNDLKLKLQRDIPIETLNEADVKDLHNETIRIHNMKTSFLQSLLCTIKFLCKKDREARLRDRTEELFSTSLDIRTLVQLQASLALMLSLFLTKDQVILFNLGRARAISKHLESDQTQNSDQDQIPQNMVPFETMKSSKKKKRLAKLVGLPVQSNRINLQLLDSVFNIKDQK